MKEKKEVQQKTNVEVKKKPYNIPGIKKSNNVRKVNILGTCAQLSGPPAPCGDGAIN